MNKLNKCSLSLIQLFLLMILTGHVFGQVLEVQVHKEGTKPWEDGGVLSAGEAFSASEIAIKVWHSNNLLCVKEQPEFVNAAGSISVPFDGMHYLWIHMENLFNSGTDCSPIAPNSLVNIELTILNGDLAGWSGTFEAVYKGYEDVYHAYLTTEGGPPVGMRLVAPVVKDLKIEGLASGTAFCEGTKQKKLTASLEGGLTENVEWKYGTGTPLPLGAGLGGSNNSVADFQLVPAGTYADVYAEMGGLKSNKVTITVQTIPENTPVITGVPTGLACHKDEVTLRIIKETNVNYKWSDGGTEASQKYTLPDEMSLKVSVASQSTAAGQCPGEKVEVTINIDPKLELILSEEICKVDRYDGSVVLNAADGSSVTAYDDQFLLEASQVQPDKEPGMPFKINFKDHEADDTYYIASADYCSKVMVQFEMNNCPSLDAFLSISTADAGYCEGETPANLITVDLTLPATDLDLFTHWSFKLKNPSQGDVLTVNVVPGDARTMSWTHIATEAGDYEIYDFKASDGDANFVKGIITDAVVKITEYSKPTVTLTTPVDDACAKTKVMFTANAAAGVTYKWNGTGSFGTKKAQEVTLLNNMNSHTVQVKDVNGCESDVITKIVAGNGVKVVADAKKLSIPANSSTELMLKTGDTVFYGQSTSIRDFTWGPTDKIDGAFDKATAKTKNLTGQTTFTVSVIDGKGCPSEQSKVTINTSGDVLGLEIEGEGELASKAGCLGEDMNLFANASGGGCSNTYDYVWSVTKSSPGGATLTLIDATKDRPGIDKRTTTAGVYEVVCKITCSDVEVSDTIDIEIYPKPTVSFTASTELACTGADLKLTAEAAGGTKPYQSYTWVGDIANTGEGAIVDLKVQAGKVGYSVTVEDEKGCVSAKSNVIDITGRVVHVAVKLDEKSGDEQNKVVMNTGASGKLTSVVSYSPEGGSLKNFVWTPLENIKEGYVLNLANTESLLSAGLFTLTVTDQNDCEGKGEVHYSLTGDLLSVGVSDITACLGTPQQLTCTPSGGVEGEYKYLWTVPTGFELDQYDIKEPTIIKGGVGEHNVKVEVKYKSQKVEKDMEVTIKALPTLVVPEDQNQQVGAIVELSATANPITSTVTWSGLPGTSAPSAGTAIMTAGPFQMEGEKHTYTVVAKDGACESVPKEVVITVVKAVEGIVFEEAKNVEHCTGANDSVRVIAKGGSGDLGFLWKQVSTEGQIRLSTNTKSEALIERATVGTHVFKVTVSDKNTTSGVKDVDTLITVVVKQTPDVRSLTLKNETNGGNSAGFAEEISLTVSGLYLGNATYKWSDDSESGTTIQSENGGQMFTYPLLSTTTYTVEATSDGCIDSLSRTVDIKKPAIISLSFKLDKKCDDSGEEMTLTMSASGGKGIMYNFDLVSPDGSGFEAFGGTEESWTKKIALADTGTYYAESFTATKNGEDLATKIIPPDGKIDAFFDKTPVIEIIDGLLQSTCDGANFTLLASSQLDGVTYTWDNKVLNGKPFVPTEAGTYTVTAVSSSSTKCSSTAVVQVLIDPKPKVTISSNKPTVDICQYDKIILTAGGDATEFEWNIEEETTGILLTGTPIEVILDRGGSVMYYVVGTEMIHGCTDTAFLVMQVGIPPVIKSTTGTERTVAIDRDVTFEVEAEGKDMAFAWQRWDGSGWLILKDNDSGKPAISGSTTNALTLKTVPQSWNGTLFRCVVKNYCGDVDTIFSLEVTKCFQLLGVELEMCEGIRPETDPAKRIDGWYCPGGRISICASIIAQDSEIDIVNPVYKWKVDGDATDSEEWGNLDFISDSSVLSWVIPLKWEHSVTISLRAYADGACDTTYERTLKLGASSFTEVDWDLKTSTSSNNMFCPNDTVTIWVEEENGDENMEHTYKWYDDGFDLAAGQSSDNVLVSLENKKLVLAMKENDTWIKVEMTPSGDVCVQDSVVTKSVKLKKKDLAEPKFFISTEDTLACFNDKVHFEAEWEDAGDNPTFQWYRDVYNLGTDWKASTDLTSDDMHIKCILTPSEEVCYDTDLIFDDIIQIRAIKDAKVLIYTDMEGKTTEDEIVIESDISGMPIKDPIYTWYINNLISQEDDEELISYDLRNNDSIQLGVNGERICQNKIMSNILYIDFDRAKRDTLLTIYQGEEVKNLNMVKPGDDLGTVIFMIEKSAEYGVSSISTKGEFTYTPMAGFIGNVSVAYKLVNRLDQKTVGKGMIYITVKDNNRFTVPNLVTPNDDGLNDTWMLDFLMDYPNHRIMVYDYLGKKVYEAKDYQNDWDGTNSFTNKNFTNGVYTYVIELGDKGETVLKAWVEIRVDLNRSNFR